MQNDQYERVAIKPLILTLITYVLSGRFEEEELLERDVF